MITSRVVALGGCHGDAAKLIQLIDGLADRKGLSSDALLMVTLDSLGNEKFEVENLITQLRINCGEFDT